MADYQEYGGTGVTTFGLRAALKKVFAKVHKMITGAPIVTTFDDTVGCVPMVHVAYDFSNENGEAINANIELAKQSNRDSVFVDPSGEYRAVTIRTVGSNKVYQFVELNPNIQYFVRDTASNTLMYLNAKGDAVNYKYTVHYGLTGLMDQTASLFPYFDNSTSGMCANGEKIYDRGIYYDPYKGEWFVVDGERGSGNGTGRISFPKYMMDSTIMSAFGQLYETAGKVAGENIKYVAEESQYYRPPRTWEGEQEDWDGYFIDTLPFAMEYFCKYLIPKMSGLVLNLKSSELSEENILVLDRLEAFPNLFATFVIYYEEEGMTICSRPTHFLCADGICEMDFQMAAQTAHLKKEDGVWNFTIDRA